MACAAQRAVVFGSRPHQGLRPAPDIARVKVNRPCSLRLPSKDAARRVKLSAEGGSILFEALVSMVLLVIFSLGFLGAVDTASKISGRLDGDTRPDTMWPRLMHSRMKAW